MIINGSLKLNFSYIESLGKITKIENGLLNLNNCPYLKDLGDLEEIIGGHLYLKECHLINNLGKLKLVDGKIHLYNSGITKEYIKKYKPEFLKQIIWK